jgi:ParB-like chromosome segregation protein Spo0J
MGKIKLSKIKANPNNPRLIKDDKFKKLVKSIETFPDMLDKRPIVCVTDTDGKIYPLGGNMRLKALKELSYSEIPETWVTMADDWTEEQKREFIIKDNVGYGEWDWDDLANNWDAEQLTEWGLDIPNFQHLDSDNHIQDLSEKIKNVFRIEIICKDEIEQETTYNKLIELNYECRLLTL